ncbi:MAG: hypothetical protein JW726_03025 [Anaerolineales bacterium]|nr:hypothetical protein [Anaerolineales bacterium]
MFEKIDIYLGAGTPFPAGWVGIFEMPLVILVGGMGAGKSTVCQALIRSDLPVFLLPDRRDLTESLIIHPLQREDGVIPTGKLDRKSRLPYIQRYHERQPAGMGYAITQLALDPSHLPQGNPWLVFDGLRGAEEIEYAYTALPQAHFIGIDAPDMVRLQRLLERQDGYDTIPAVRDSTSESTSELQRLGVPQAEQIFSPAELHSLLESVRHGDVAMQELRNKLTVLCLEHKMYDLKATFSILRSFGKQRSLYINSANQNPRQVADHIIAYLQGQK